MLLQYLWDLGQTTLLKDVGTCRASGAPHTLPHRGAGWKRGHGRVGQTATSRDVRVAAALPPKAEIRLRCNICRNGPVRDITTLLNYLVGELKE